MLQMRIYQNLSETCHMLYYWVSMELWYLHMHRLLVTFKQCLQWLFNVFPLDEIYQYCGHLHYTGSSWNHYMFTVTTKPVANLLLTYMGHKFSINEL